jgi:hypothetical protein
VPSTVSGADFFFVGKYEEIFSHPRQQKEKTANNKTVFIFLDIFLSGLEDKIPPFYVTKL